MNRTTPEIEVTTRGDIAVLHLRGRFIIGVGDVALHDVVAELINKGSRKLIIDMTDLYTIDSSVLGELVAVHFALANVGGRVSLVNLPSKVVDLLRLTKLETVFEVFDSIDGSVAHFQT